MEERENECCFWALIEGFREGIVFGGGFSGSGIAEGEREGGKVRSEKIGRAHV